MEEKPKDITEYKKWLKENHKIDLSDKIKNHYESVTEKMKQQFIISDFWKQLVKNISEYNDEYLIDKQYHLFQDMNTPEISTKPFKSIIEKTYRKNIIENENYPNPPITGWILPENWYLYINDILRTTLVVKYLDGVDFLVQKIKLLCEGNNKDFSCYFEAREVGYYAVHLYTRDNFEIPKIDWDTYRVDTDIEIQITTQLQEVIRKLLHKYYEERRIKIVDRTEKSWQWDYRSDEFATNYLGHILHYVEGMIVDIREKENENAKAKI